jgi:Polyketide cyclase / dehydrase and lipid transport
VKLRVGITIAASPAEVWRVIEPIERHVDWMADAASITFTSRAQRGVGTRFDCVTRIGPLRTTDRMAVTEWEPRQAMGIEHHGVVTGRGRFTLRRRPRGRTRFTWTEQLRFPLWMGGPIGAFAAKPVLRAVWRRNLRRLKQLVETGA